jgi:recombination protein RecT
MMNHADAYSPAFSASMYEKVQNGEVAKEDMWKYSSFWYKNFGDMARKTLLRQLIGKWGVMSVELQNAFSGDTTTVSIDGNNNLIPIPIAPDDEPPVTGAPNPVPNPDIARPEADTVIEKVDLSAL